MPSLVSLSDGSRFLSIFLTSYADHRNIHYFPTRRSSDLTTPPTITCPPDMVLECPANTSTNVTGMATAQDGCGLVTIGYSDMVTKNCGGTKIIRRTMTATAG